MLEDGSGKRWVGLAVAVGVLMLIVLVFESSLAAGLEGTISALAAYHAYMIGLVFPETVYIKILWNEGAERAANPFSGRFVATGLFVLIGAGIAIIGYLWSTEFLVPSIEAAFRGALGTYWGVLGYLVWLPVSIPLLAFVFFAIASPAGLRDAVDSLRTQF